MKYPRTFILFLFSAVLILLTLISIPLLSTIHEISKEFIQGIFFLIAVGIGITGFVSGIININKNRNTKYWIGFVGNFIILLLFISLITFIILKLPEH
jgi:hypothetical protein